MTNLFIYLYLIIYIYYDLCIITLTVGRHYRSHLLLREQTPFNWVILTRSASVREFREAVRKGGCSRENGVNFLRRKRDRRIIPYSKRLKQRFNISVQTKCDKGGPSRYKNTPRLPVRMKTKCAADEASLSLENKLCDSAGSL